MAGLLARALAFLHPAHHRSEPETTVKVILGLGNPGREYENTRHNVGWMVLDHLADVWRFPGWRKDGEALTSSGTVNGVATRLVKPLTYMNLSGQVLKPWLRRPFWAAAKDLLVVVDEVALPLGSIRLRATGSAGGHNGLKSIEHHLKSRDYPRLRIGIKPPDERREIGDLSDFVLGPFGKIERGTIDEMMPVIRSAIETFIADGILPAMNKYNSKSS
ncbi:MAG: aminoacyl-tRNA hydrolase [Gemmatimonadaceae bacterium]|nr:aminoacyl-tRNA hydrolase [Gemmatimonadaceae bacterium]NUQ94961.1 aminoacyl-tRNA hydrolase [Gemmatimonadaceae bacterium]